MTEATSVLWFRRDLRFEDHPALAKAAERGSVAALFVLDPVLMGRTGLPRLVFLLRALRHLDERLRSVGAHLIVRSGRPQQIVPQLARELGADQVHISADFGPYGSTRDRRVAEALGPVSLVATGSPYAISPPRLTTGQGTPYRVFTPFLRAWRAHGWPRPAASSLHGARWISAPSEPLPAEPALSTDVRIPPAGEAAALSMWTQFREDRIHRYPAERDRPDLESTSRLSAHLHFGTIHPRTLLGALGPEDERFMTELAWRDFYAAVLWNAPESAWTSLDRRMNGMPTAQGTDADRHFEAWCDGMTGYPIIDAGMRQLRAEAWMHNRVRMLVASFLVKDLHLEWQRGAAHFMASLVDGDLANNQHGWQWCAGTGTDASPYFRIFNPVTQAKRFDPDGVYVRRWVPELRSVPDRYVHEPWRSPDPPSYPLPIVDHDTERRRSLEAYAALRR